MALVAMAHPAMVDRATVGAALAAVLVGAEVAVAVVRRGRDGPPRPPRAIAVPAGAWLVGLLAAAAANDAWSAPALLPPFLGVGLLWLGARWGRRGLPALAHGAAAGAAIAALHAWSQRLGCDPLPRVDEFAHRVVGPFSNPNHLGGLAAACLPLLLAGYLKALGEPDRRRPVFAAAWGAGALIVYGAALLAGSRGALWAAAAGALVVAVGALGRRGVVAPRPAVLAMAGLLAAETAALRTQPVAVEPGRVVSVGQRLEAMSNVAGAAARQDATVLHRRVLWLAAARVFAEHPWLGAGPGRLAAACEELAPRLRADADVVELSRLGRLQWLPHAHDEPLHMAAEAGLAGLLPLAFLVAAGVGLGGLSAWQGAGGALGWGALGAVSAVIVQGLVSYPLHMPAISGLFWLLLGIISTPSDKGRVTSA